MEGKNDTKKNRKRQSRLLRTVQPDAAGIDLGSREHWVACPPLPDGSPNVERFGTTTPELSRLADWLKQQHIATVAMESTGVYLDFGHFYVLGIQVAQCLVILVSELAEVMIEIRVHLITTNGFQSHNFNSQAFLGNGQSRVRE